MKNSIFPSKTPKNSNFPRFLTCLNFSLSILILCGCISVSPVSATNFSHCFASWSTSQFLALIISVICFFIATSILISVKRFSLEVCSTINWNFSSNCIDFFDFFDSKNRRFRQGWNWNLYLTDFNKKSIKSNQWHSDFPLLPHLLLCNPGGSPVFELNCLVIYEFSQGFFAIWNLFHF